MGCGGVFVCLLPLLLLTNSTFVFIHFEQRQHTVFTHRTDRNICHFNNARKIELFKGLCVFKNFLTAIAIIRALLSPFLKQYISFFNKFLSELYNRTQCLTFKYISNYLYIYIFLGIYYLEPRKMKEKNKHDPKVNILVSPSNKNHACFLCIWSIKVKINK